MQRDENSREIKVEWAESKGEKTKKGMNYKSDKWK